MLVSVGSVMYCDGVEDPKLPIKAPSVINKEELLKSVASRRIKEEEAARAILLLHEYPLVPDLFATLGKSFALELCRHDDWFCISRLTECKEAPEFAVVCAGATTVSHRGFQGIFGESKCGFTSSEWERIVDAWIDGFEGLPYAIPSEFENFSLTLEIPPVFDNIHIQFSETVKTEPVDELCNQLSKIYTLASKLEWKELKPLLEARKQRLPENVKKWLDALLECEVPQKRARIEDD